MDNAFLAERLEAFAALLDLPGSGYYTVRAYRRAAELIRATPADVADLVRAGRVRGARRDRAGNRDAPPRARDDGELAELRELEEQALPELVGVGRLLGLSPKRMQELGGALGVRTVAELREAADEGRLTQVPGIGPKTAERIARVSPRRAAARPRRGMLLNRARALVGEIAAASRRASRQAIRAAACDLSSRFAVVVPRSGRPRSTSSGCRRSSASSSGRTSAASASRPRAIRSRSSSPPPSASEPSSSRDRLARVRRRARAPARMPPRRRSCTTCSAFHYGRPSCVSSTRATRRQICSQLQRHPRRPARAFDGVGREGDGARDGARCAGAAATSTWRSATTRRRCGSYRASTPTACAARARRSQRRTSVLAPFRLLRGIEGDILPDGSLDLPDDVLAELEWVQISLHAGQRWGREPLTKRVLEAMRHPAAAFVCRTRRAGSSTTGRRTRSISSRSSRSRWRRAWRSR